MEEAEEGGVRRGRKFARLELEFPRVVGAGDVSSFSFLGFGNGLENK